MSTSSGSVEKQKSRTFGVTAGYFVAAAGDLGGDGFTDLVFTSASNDLWLWTNSQRGGWASARVGDYPGQWRLMGSGDVNGDGSDDLLWLDPSECKFAYWLMRGRTRIGSRTYNVTCGYYPLGIGYYSPSNRISILWTSPAHDLYVWDSKPHGFATYNLTSHILATGGGMESVWAIGAVMRAAS